MSVELLLAMIIFVLVISTTPGPNNLMLLASGVNYGFRRSLPHVFGICFGFAFMILVIGLGLGQLFVAYPITYQILRYGGGAYMVWLAWQIANSGPVDSDRSAKNPMTFIQAALFQWVNPKAWIMAISSIATYTPGNGALLPLIILSVVFGVFCFPSISLWVLGGTALRNYLSNMKVVRIFNIAMAVLLVLSMAPLLWH